MADKASGSATEMQSQQLSDVSHRALGRVLRTLDPIEDSFDPIDDPLPRAINFGDEDQA